ncbi:MAG: hypothetical protein ACYDGR_03150 [Candidatus Dormibacteria bacterium]
MAAPEWILVGASLAVIGGVVAWLLAKGDPGKATGLRGYLLRFDSALGRLSGLPGWCAGGLLLGFYAVLIAGIGFYWDVAWHLDLGRDAELLTPPHVLILTGLSGLGVSAVVATMMATAAGVPVGVRVGPIRLPYSAIPLGLLGFGSVSGLPLDNVWHQIYGIDVTMWSPTHLLMIGGGAFAPLAMLLMLAEGDGQAMRPRVRRLLALQLGGAALVGLSTFQLEYDLGVPQWQALYQPVLIMLAGAVILVAARISLGRWAAIWVALGFLLMRSTWLVMDGPVLGHTIPRFPLFLGVAAVVEVSALMTRRVSPLPRALILGASVGTFGLASEWLFSQIWSWHPWQPSLWPGLWAATAMAMAGSLLGMVIGRVLSHRRPGVPNAVIGIAGLAVAALLLVPAGRTESSMPIRVSTRPDGPPRLQLDQFGTPGVVQDVRVVVHVDPSAVAGADWFEALAWQGGGKVATPLQALAPGTYRAARAVPTGSSWKTLVWLVAGDRLLAAPVAMPAGPGPARPAVPLAAERETTLSPASDLLLPARAAAGPAASLIIAAAVMVVMAWMSAFLYAFAGVARSRRYLRSC